MGKQKSRVCVVCRRKNAVKDSNACGEHLHVVALQKVIDDQTSLSSGGVASLLGHEAFRRMLKVLLEAKWLATVGKGSSLATIGRSGFDDGTVEYGTSVLHSASAAQVKKFQGLLGVMMQVVGRCADECEDLIDPSRERRKDSRIRCGECPDPRTRQRWQSPDSRFCRWCGRSFIEEEEGAA